MSKAFAPLSRRPRFFERSGVYPVEKCPGLLRVLTGHGDGDVLVLDEVVAGRRLFREHPVVFPAVQVQVIPALAHEDAVLKSELLRRRL